VILAHGSRDPRSAATVHSLVKCLREMRADLRIEASFLDHCPPKPFRVIDKLSAEGVEEIVILPLLLSSAFHARVDVPAVVDEARSRFPDLRIIASDVLGYDDSLLDVLDRRMRAELKDGRVRELDALVLACAGSSDTQANAAVARLARLWGQRHRLPVVAAFTTAASPSPAGRSAMASGGSSPRGGRLLLPRTRAVAGSRGADGSQGRCGRGFASSRRERRGGSPGPAPVRRSRPGPADPDPCSPPGSHAT
jgi:sirohydrochlorin ferrochelatase